MPTKPETKKTLKLFNTLGREKQEFKPIKKGEVGLYSCGPTVYWYQHTGNIRAYIFVDILRRVLEYNKYKVKHIINITDVGHLTSDADTGEDKMERAAKKEGKSAEDIANYYFSAFEKDLEKSNILPPTKWTKATEHIQEQIDLVKQLEEKGVTYKTSDGIYFDTSKLKDYGELANLNIEGLEEGKRVNLGEKKNKTDFALWKFSNPPEKRLQEWDSPWGKGFPGWHIECSAMSMKYLGEHFDIHTGGEDHIPVHHTNEIAQAEAATGKKVVNYWLHNAFLVNKEGEKISKSKGGLYTISELEDQGFTAKDYRYFCLLTHYRKPLMFSLENLEAAKTSLSRIERKIIELKKAERKGTDRTKTYLAKFEDAINDDLNTPLALQVLQEVLDDFDFEPKAKLKLLETFDKIFALDLLDAEETLIVAPKEVESLVREREKLRKEKKWAEADIIRNRIREEGYEVVDTEEGSKLVRK